MTERYKLPLALALLLLPIVALLVLLSSLPAGPAAGWVGEDTVNVGSGPWGAGVEVKGR